MFGAAAIYGTVTQALAGRARRDPVHGPDRAARRDRSLNIFLQSSRGHVPDLDRRRRAVHGADRLRRPAHPVGRPRGAARVDGEGGRRRRAPALPRLRQPVPVHAPARSAAADRSAGGAPLGDRSTPAVAGAARPDRSCARRVHRCRTTGRDGFGCPVRLARIPRGRTGSGSGAAAGSPRRPAAAARTGSPGRCRSPCSERLELGLGLDAFGDDADAQAVGQAR